MSQTTHPSPLSRLDASASPTVEKSVALLIDEDVLKIQTEVTDRSVGYFGLYRYASPQHRVILLCCVVIAIGAGAALPLMTLIIGHAVGTIKTFSSGLESAEQFRNDTARYPIYFLYFGGAQFVAVYLATIGFLYVGHHVAQKTRERYLLAILRQNIGFFDKLGAGEVISRVTDGVHHIQASISEKAAAIIMAASTIVTAIIVSVVSFWKLALIGSSSLIAVVLVIGFASRFLGIYSKRADEAHSRAAMIAEEVLGSIKIVKALGAGQKLAATFDSHIRDAERWGVRAKIVLGSMIGGVFCIVMLNVALSLWQGSRYIVALETSPNAVSTVILSMLIGTFTLVTLAPIAGTIATGLAAGAKIFDTIDRSSPLDPCSGQGEKLERVRGDIDFRDITLVYPSRPNSTVLRNVSLHVPAGKTTAIIGPSGSGKTTFVNLLQRFYLPVKGEISLDGHHIKDLNLRWFRQQMSLVDQDPILFSTTIFENIALGLIGSSLENTTLAEKMSLVINAAKKADAHGFISSLPSGYDTVLQERGASLSGGQRQRIAISRAIIRDPRILLLDEPTSALDTKSEIHFQEALRLAAKGRTTIVIAHRLSTIKDADNIVVLDKGEIIEQGSYRELYEQKGAFYTLLNTQQFSSHTEAAENSAHDKWPQSSGGENGLRDGTHSRTSIEIDNFVQRKGSLKVGTKFESPAIDATESHPVAMPKPSIPELLRFLFSLNRTERGWILLGLLVSLMVGAGTPVHVIFLANGVTVISFPESLFSQLRSDINFWSGMYIILAAVLLVLNLIQGCSFGISSERLIYRVKQKIFRTFLTQDSIFFDNEKNSVGALVYFLSTSPSALGGISGPILGTILAVSTTITAAIAIAIGYGWKLGLICTSTVPVLLLCGFLRLHLLAKVEQRAKDVHENSAARAGEAIATIRTIASLTGEEHVLRKYHDDLSIQRKAILKPVLSISVLYAFSFSCFYFCMALNLWYASSLLATHEYSALQLWICFVEILFSTQSAGTIFAFAPDMAKAKTAARLLKNLFDGQQPPPLTSSEPLILMKGEINFRNVVFSYPTRPTHIVLKDLSFSIKPGQFVAFVGSSGCGKSTVISLLERFYSPSKGSILIDGRNILSLDADFYRASIALVNQDVRLFQGTIRGRNHNEGLDTNIGNKGHLLSGGQRQRIAIARALIRNPRILLLDEATSKLDSASEASVQTALDFAARGRTTLLIAHRLSSIVKADVIYTLSEGRIVEHGTHQELMEKMGMYYEFAKLQTLK